MCAIIFSIVLLLLSMPQFVAAGPVWIDADLGCGQGATDDVDDCWAIIAAIRSSALSVVGVSTVFGNVASEQVIESAEDLFGAIRLHESGRVLPSVHHGAALPLQQVTGIPPAVAALESALTTSPLTILALGPLTNVAILMKHRPELIPRITAVVAVAGQRPGQVFRVGNSPILHFHDFNVRKDPDAVEIVLRSGVPLYLIPFEAGHQIVITRRDLRALEEQGALDAWLSKRSARWLEFWEHTLDAKGFSPFDLIAVAFLVDPSQFICQTIPAKLLRRHGLFVTRHTLEVSSTFESYDTVRYCAEVSSTLRSAPIKLINP